jgi:hypothetical protein
MLYIIMGSTSDANMLWATAYREADNRSCKIYGNRKECLSVDADADIRCLDGKKCLLRGFIFMPMQSVLTRAAGGTFA